MFCTHEVIMRMFLSDGLWVVQFFALRIFVIFEMKESITYCKRKFCKREYKFSGNIKVYLGHPDPHLVIRVR